MEERQIVQDIARQALTLSRSANTQDYTLWDRAQRLIRTVEFVSRLPELADSGARIDYFCLEAATYFNDAGLAGYLKAGKTIPPVVSNAGGKGVDFLDWSTQIVKSKLSSVIEDVRIRRINRIIIESGERSAQSTEAKILSDARNLDDMGAIGLFNNLRQDIIGGRSVASILKSWRMKKDYRYWEACLKECFRFESVRKIAENRLSAVHDFMEQFGVEDAGRDFEALLADSRFALNEHTAH